MTTQKTLHKIPFVQSFASRIGSMSMHTWWAVALVVFIILVVVSVLGHVWWFVGIRNAEVTEILEGSASEIQTVNRGTLEEVITFFGQREQRFNNIKNVLPSGIPDPS